MRRADVQADYQARIVGDVKLARPIKIVVDCGNGVAGASAPGIFRALGCEVIELFSEVDGEFPNHHPDPSKPENLRDVIEALRTSDAELGLAFDGDGDRLGIVTKDGQNIFPDRQMMLFARTCSRACRAAASSRREMHAAPGARHPRGRGRARDVQDRALVARMKELDAPLGGEMSGGHGFDDGTYAGCRLLRQPRGRPQRLAQRAAHQRECGLRRGRAPSPAAEQADHRPRSAPSTACAWTGPTASA